MKNFHNIRTQIWGIALLVAFTGAPLITATAAPDPNPPASADNARRSDDRRNDDRRRDDDNRRDNRYESASTYRGTVEILLPDNEFNARINGRIYKVYSLGSTRDLRVGDAIDIDGQMDRGVNIRNARVSINRRNDNNDRDNNNWPNFGDNRRDFNTYTGEVTDVQSDRKFEVRIDGRNYDVTTDSSTRRVNRGDIVRITGRREGNNDIREARLTVTRSNDDRYNNYGNDRDARSYDGVVTRVDNSREFEVRIDGRTYRVSSDAALRNLNRGDEVRIYGRRDGNDEIRNADVRVTRQNYDNGQRVTLKGVVTRVHSDRDFDIVVDRQTYNVRTDSATSNLNRGDEVRVYGQLFDGGDVRSANAYVTRNR